MFKEMPMLFMGSVDGVHCDIYVEDRRSKYCKSLIAIAFDNGSSSEP